MDVKCRNCKNLTINEEGEFECKCYAKIVNPDNSCSECPYSRICYVLLDRVPLVKNEFKK